MWWALFILVGLVGAILGLAEGMRAKMEREEKEWLESEEGKAYVEELKRQEEWRAKIDEQSLPTDKGNG